MKEGTVGAILDFSMRDDFVEESAHKAFHEFFGIAVNECPELDELPEADTAYFSEWLVFDFRLPNGKTLLEYYIERNPDTLSGAELKTYRDLLTNEYGLWEVLEIELGLRLELRNVQTDQIFEVKECRGTFDMRKGNLFYGRVALVEGRWELVTGTTHVWGVRLAGGAKEYLRKMKDRLSPKDAWRFAKDGGKDRRTMVEEPLVDFADAELKLDAVLKKYQLANYVDVARIEEWLRHDKNRFNAIPASLLVGLLSDTVSLKKAGPEIVNALLGIAQSMPLAQLKGRSPQEAYRDREARGKRPDIRLNVTPLGGNEWNEAYSEAVTFLQNYEFGKALRGIQKAFKIMLAAKTTIYDVFRLYGNLALCYFAAGDKARGKRTLDIALELNPNYDFALELEKNYENGNYDSGLVSGVRGVFSGASHFFRGIDYANRYYDFIKPFDITFATKHLTHTPHVVIGPEGSRRIGRNDPCYCGSGKKFKKCHGA